jgi:2-dehydro-3-deoxyphosphooctonate aldolase (KDO 8-P synthase)
MEQGDAERAGARASFRLGERTLGGGRPFVLAGPCVLEGRGMVMDLAGRLAELARDRGLDLIFKSSFDKANRSSLGSERGPGLEEGLELLADVRLATGLPLVTDVHHPEQCAPAAEVVDVLQIPAFLCRQTDLVLAAARTGRAVNVKKGQFLAPWDMRNVVAKARAAGNGAVLVTERGTCFGYGRLVVDMTGFQHLARTGAPIVFDATHSVQEPGALGTSTGGDREQAPVLARAAVATGLVDGLFFEVHPDPDRAPSDGPNMVRLADFGAILDGVLAIHAAAQNAPAR